MQHGGRRDASSPYCVQLFSDSKIFIPVSMMESKFIGVAYLAFILIATFLSESALSFRLLKSFSSKPIESLSSFNYIDNFEYSLGSRMNTHELYMSSVMDRPSSVTTPAYLTSPMTPRYQLMSQLTKDNRKYHDLGLEFRASYEKLRLLTEEEEITAAKFSNVGKRLERVKKNLNRVLGREPSQLEWSKAVGIPVKKLEEYLACAEEARKTLVMHNIRIVDYWVRKIIEHSYLAKKVSYYELMVEGLLGLTKAAETFDGRGRFSSYAHFLVRLEVMRGLTVLRQGNILGHRSMLLAIKSSKIKKQLEQELNRKPTDEEIARKLKITVKTLRALRIAAATTVISAENSVSSDESSDSQTYLDLFSKQDQSKKMQEEMIWKHGLKGALSILTPTEQRALFLRYGLIDGIPKTIEKTAALMCISGEGLRKITNVAFEKLRNQLPMIEWGPNGDVFDSPHIKEVAL